MYSNCNITIHPPLKGEHLAYLLRFHNVRHMKRDVKLLEKLRDPLRTLAGLPLGEEGEYYVAGARFSIEHDDQSIVDHNTAPEPQPHLWCEWIPDGSGEKLEWSSGNPDRYSSDEEWLEYLVEHFFTPWGYELRGEIIDRIFG
ncbi:hypothetical protein QUF76_08720 [Desulfobacterales bacterium HSG16]|nr:hypothetical protein [Desulfobacterales bacterium HSG16]